MNNSSKNGWQYLAMKDSAAPGTYRQVAKIAVLLRPIRLQRIAAKNWPAIVAAGKTTFSEAQRTFCNEIMTQICYSISLKFNSLTNEFFIVFSKLGGQYT